MMTYDNLHHIMETAKTMDKVKVQAPKQFTKQGVIEYLESRGGKAIMDTRAVAAILERDMQTIRRYAKRGELKCDMSVFNRAVYSIEDVADFLLAHPSICGMSKNEFQLTEKTTELIRRIACKNWKPLVDRLGLDDVVVEVQLRLLKKRSVFRGEDLGGVIQHILANIYRKAQRQVSTIPLSQVEGRI